MSTRATMFMVTVWSVFVLTGNVSGQEVNSDVKIPPPREIVAGAPAVSGLFSGSSSLFAVPGQAFQGVVDAVALGTLSEGETRDELGDFMSSLLVRAGIITFDGSATTRQASGREPADGSRPAWRGSTPMALSVSLTRRAASVRQR